MSQKNILFILADQLRADFCACYGATWLKTPHINQLAQEGVQYQQAISPSPLCVPARASLLTGRSAVENRVTDNSYWLRPDHDEMGVHTWPSLLSRAGYHTAAIGKMHFYPWDISEGFEHRVIADDKRHYKIEDDYTLYLRKHGYQRLHGNTQEGYYEYLGAVVSDIPEKHQIDRFVCDEACAYLEQLDTTRPFAMMVGFPGPHCPYDPAQEVIDRMPDSTPPTPYPVTAESEPFRQDNVSNNLNAWNGVDLNILTTEKALRIRKHYSALVQAIDDYIGELIETLKRKNLYEDTVIILSADHGDFLGDYGMCGKHVFYESATHVPLIVKDTQGTQAAIAHAVSLTDIFNTILHFAQLPYHDTVDSTTLAPFGACDVRAPIFGCTNKGWMIRDSRYLYTEYENGISELYDVQTDKGQQHNLIADPAYAAQAKSMHKLLMQRGFAAMEAGNHDMIARFDSTNKKTGIDPFYHQGWKRPYPYKDIDGGTDEIQY